MPLSRLLALLALGLALVAGCTSAPAPRPAPEPSATPTAAPVPGLAVYRVAGDVRGAVARLQQALGRAGGTVATVDHAADAATAGRRLRPTTLVVGSDPRAGTPLQQGAAVAGVDLPARFLVWQDAAGAVWLGHNSAAYVAARAGTSSSSTAVADLDDALAAVARRGAGTAAPVATGEDVDDVSTEGYLTTTLTSRPVADVVTALRAGLARAGHRPVTVVDHARRAAAVGAPLPSSTVVLARPATATELLQDRQTVAIDLPMRYLAWSDGTVTRISRPDPTVLAARHGLRGRTSTLGAMAAAQERIATAAAGAATPS